MSDYQTCECKSPVRAPDGSCRKCGLPGAKKNKPEVHVVPKGAVINIQPRPPTTSTEASRLLGD